MSKNNESPKGTVSTSYIDKVKNFEDRKAMVTIAPITVAKPSTAPASATTREKGSIINLAKDIKK